MNDLARLALPVVAVVGRPNVGKSSLVNRVLGQREAIVEATPGVTRDRRAFVATWGSRSFEIVDTGGLEAGQQGLEALVAEQAEVAIAGSDVIMLVVDASTGPIEDDLVLARRLRASDKPVLVAANKVDDGRDEASVASFYRLGLGDPIPVSALHGRGSGDLLDALVDLLPGSTGSGSSAWASIAIVGRPNVGKSSLLNALLGEPRSIVDRTPGTTRDPVDAELTLPGDRTLKIIDTAGMRKRVRIEDPLEYFSWIRSRRVLERADAIVFVVDAADGATGLDQRLLEAIIESGRACVIALNKWDLIDLDGPDRDRFERDLNERLRFLPWATVLRVSALTGRGVVGIPGMVDRAISSHRRRLTTSHVNRIVADAQAERPHPRTRGRSIRVRYAVQAEVAPPTFVLFSSGALEVSYLRYLEGRIRRVEAFDGSPVRLQYRVKTRGEH